MKALAAALLLLSMQRAQPTLDAVLNRASAYSDTYLKELGSIAGEERYVQEATWQDSSIRSERRKITTHRTRQLVSDILTVPIGGEWIGIRHVRQVDDIVLDPMYRGVWRQAFDESTPEGREKLQDAFTFESTRYNIGDFSRSTNIPTFPLDLLSKNNLPLLTFSKTGEERIGNFLTWKVRFNDRGRNTLMMDTHIAPRERYSLSGTLWLEPSTGRMFRAELDFKHANVEDTEVRMSVQFRFEPALGMLVPWTMEEYYQSENLQHEITCHADYTNFRRFSSDVRLDSDLRHVLGASSGDLTAEGEDRYAVKVDVRVVNVEAWVTSNSGMSVTDLKLEDFKVLENKIQQSITNFSPVSTPYDVLLLFDRSGSTQRDWTTMQRAAEGFIAQARPQDRIGIAYFDTSFRMLSRWTNTREQLGRIVEELTKGKRPGGTWFYRAVQTSLAAELLPVAGRRRALVVLTDGRDNGMYRSLLRYGDIPSTKEEPAFRQMIDLAVRERVPIYVVNFSNPGNEVMSLTLRYSEAIADSYLNAVAARLEQLVEVSGGRVLFPRKLDDIIPLYAQISRELGTAYSIGYVSNLPLDHQGFREIQVSTRDPRLRVVQSRAGYVSQ